MLHLESVVTMPREGDHASMSSGPCLLLKVSLLALSSVQAAPNGYEGMPSQHATSDSARMMDEQSMRRQCVVVKFRELSEPD